MRDRSVTNAKLIINSRGNMKTQPAKIANAPTNFIQKWMMTALALISLLPHHQISEASTSAPPPASCKQMYFGSLGVRCMLYGEDTPTAYSGTDTSTIAPLNQWCPEIPIGQLIYGVTPAPGSLACYQFAVEANTSINYQVSLPPDISGKAEVFRILSNGAGFPVARAESPASPLASSLNTQYVRLALVVRTSNGNGGQVYGLGINTTVPQPLPSASTLADARRIEMNEELRETLASPQDTVYYFYPLRNGQTTALINASFNHSNLQITVQPAKKLLSGSYSTSGTPTILGSTQSNGTPWVFTSAYPANTASTTEPTGVMIKVTGTTSSTFAAEPYQVRAGVRTVHLVGFDITNTENISRWYPTTTAMVQAANNIVTVAGVKDHNGAWVRNHPVQLTVQRFNSAPSTKQITTHKTNYWGKMAVNQALPASGSTTPVTTLFAAPCSGSVTTKNNYGPPGSPSDHWNGTAQTGSVNVLLQSAQPSTGNPSTLTFNFTRICSETYLGYY